MGAGRSPNYNPRTGTWTKPKASYEKGRKSSKGGDANLLATLALPLLPVLLPVKIVSDLKKAGKKSHKKKK